LPRFCSSSLSSFLYAQLSSWAFEGGVLGGCEEAQECKEDAVMVAAEEQRADKQ
jgi:hypothetical protein